MMVESETLLIKLITGIPGYVSQINSIRESLHIYFAQLRHHQENIDLYSCTKTWHYLLLLNP